ncbi:regulator [Plasticicumulans sp.]|uniref:regulator n=1 Tax=Plasticicumulans sp. TaxID=2307179 RepID=UPI002C0C500C|nr:regulator [Plasticicumulans sp.]HMW29988.1 regulator [Plasticicumulans sp.]HMZ12478.1 regulator [Plasticicumulans sp.]HNG49763.1 regulator [Plasticicumulans sp.]HNI22226.1 regulator [Plasticicumulans sp.]HNK30775.1 regulator [Plasticicumulans sp.]
MPEHTFDDSSIRWNRFGEFEPAFHFTILDIDESRRIADVLFRLPAEAQIVLHRHLVLNHTFVVQGEHRLYEPDGSLREARATGTHTVSPASERPHREGGGAQDAIVHFSIRPDGADDLYELLDDAGNPLARVTWPMLVELYRAQAA